MRIKLTTNIEKFSETACVAGTEYDAVLIHPHSSTVEFLNEAGTEFRAFHYEYEELEVAEAAE
tara:strand:- start:41 stop:229 length:189 start_codon:yes stop_codon:yes gene_type:complete